MSNIIPTVGRKVYYRPSKNMHHPDGSMIILKKGNIEQPLDATVVAVLSDDCVNLVIFDIAGQLYSRMSVAFIQDGEPKPEGGGYAEWMPYQIKQAAKDEQLTGGVSGSTHDDKKAEKAKVATQVILDKALAYDEAMEKLNKVGVPMGLLLVDRIEWMMANGAKAETVDQTSPTRPMLHYGIKDLRAAWDHPCSTVLMGDGKPFDKTAINAELCYRGDDYKQPRYVASPLAPKTKTA